MEHRNDHKYQNIPDYQSGINDPTLTSQKLEAWPPGQGELQINIPAYPIPTHTYQLNDLASGWYSSPFSDGFSLKLANLDSAIDLTSSRSGGLISALHPVSDAEIEIVQLTAYGTGYGYWAYRFPNARIFPLSMNEHNQVRPADLPLRAQTALKHRATIYIDNQPPDMKLSLKHCIQTLNSAGSAVWRLNIGAQSLATVYQSLIWLQTVFNQVGLIQLACGPPGEFWIWAKHRVLDKHLGSAVQHLNSGTDLGITQEQSEYISKFWNALTSKQYVKADRAINHQARQVWLVY